MTGFREIESQEGGETSDEMVYTTGIDGLSGEPLDKPIRESEMAQKIRAMDRDKVEERSLAWNHRNLFNRRGPDRRPMPHVDPKDLASAGWSVVFASSTSKRVRSELEPLIRHRQEQATKQKEGFFRQLDHEAADGAAKFMHRNKIPHGPADPRNFPYYVLLVGSPEEMPFEFQYMLDQQYAVGRLHFETPEEYGAYARGVLQAEGDEIDVRPDAAFLAVQHRGDRATEDSSSRLVEPLFRELREKWPEWGLRAVGDTGKAQVRELFGGQATPSLLFATSHGVRWPSGHAVQATHQGALLCGDWLGGPVELTHCLGAPDIDDAARLKGLIAFLFGCYTAGTPARDNFPAELFRNPTLAPKPMLAPLAQRLLGHPNGGALAVIGHIDRAWTLSFAGPGMAFLPFSAFLYSLADGHPVGSAMDWMNEKFSELSTRVTNLLDPQGQRAQRSDNPPDPQELSKLWRGLNDARNLLVLGDPAVRLAGIRSSSSHPTTAQSRLRETGSRIRELLGKIQKRSRADLDISPTEILRRMREDRP